MKKVIAFILTLASVFMLSGCKAKNDDNSNSAIIEPNVTAGEIVAYQGVQQENELTFANAINIDNKYFIYYFFLGTISKVPLYTSVAMQYTYDTEVTFNFNKLTSESISNSISKSIATIDTHSYNGGFSVGYSQELSVEADLYLAKAKATLSATQETDHHWTNNWGSTVTDSETTATSYLTQYSNGYSEKVAFSELAGFNKGNYYRMSFYNTVSAFGVLAYDVMNNSYSAASDFFLEANSTIRVWEESAEAAFKYEQHKDLKFDVNQAIDYAENHKLELNVSKEEGEVLVPSKNYIATNPLSCKIDNKYNYDQPDPNGNNIHYSHNFNFGDFVIDGCVKSSAGKDTYNLIKNFNVELSFRLDYDSNNLPTQDNMVSRYVSIDTKQSGFYNLPWNVGERDVQKGMIVALVEYYDGSPSDKICITNAFDNIKGGSKVVIANEINKPCKVTIAICYELVQWAPGFLGIVDDYWMNWRINQTVYFN